MNDGKIDFIHVTRKQLRGQCYPLFFSSMNPIANNKAGFYANIRTKYIRENSTFV